MGAILLHLLNCLYVLSYPVFCRTLELTFRCIWVCRSCFTLEVILISRLDGSTRYTYQGYATSSFSASAQVSTVSVVRAIVAAAAQPAYAKISDYFGRVSILLISCVFYVVGTSDILSLSVNLSSTRKHISSFSHTFDSCPLHLTRVATMKWYS